MILSEDKSELFKLKPIKAAKVSEVSEATAASDVPINERVNFHIGNPVQDDKLLAAYFRLACSLDVADDEYHLNNLNAFVEKLGSDDNNKPFMQLLLNLINVASPYSPRGGFNKNTPPYLINWFLDWLVKYQSEPLLYDLGTNTGKREIIISTGGFLEALRLIFFALDDYLVHLPAKIIVYGDKFPDYLTKFKNLNFIFVNSNEESFLDAIKESAKNNLIPHFILFNKIFSEKTRRNLRSLSLNNPLFFIEYNNAPNSHSLAREAKMENKVLRLISAEAFNNKLTNSSIVFLAGNYNFINVIENVQFKLKGTPSSTEIEFLSFLLNNINNYFDKESITNNQVIPQVEKSAFPIIKNNTLSSFAEKYSNKLSSIIDKKDLQIAAYPPKFYSLISNIQEKIKLNSPYFTYDLFSEINSINLIELFIKHFNDNFFTDNLFNSFLFQFIKHHPEYNKNYCCVVSGSARTALSILGYHCGINTVIFPDLSWTYEHCFPNTIVVPLKDNLQLDVNILIETAIKQSKINKSNFAVAINNPHNATGMQFAQDDLRQLLKVLLQNNIYVIDDLSYQNVAPEKEFKQIKTLRMLANELYNEGYITKENNDKLITVHSLSKTDSFAGARLSVVEIREELLYNRFTSINKNITPNYAAIIVAYLFYRNKPEFLDYYYGLRNNIFYYRMQALEEAVANLPLERNFYKIKIKAPLGSMYPQMIIENLPAGISLDWLASGLARQGIGLIPLSTFARTEEGFESGRKTFRLTLGGKDNAEILLKKTRRVIIDLNRMIAEEEAGYTIKSLPNKDNNKIDNNSTIIYQLWNNYSNIIINECKRKFKFELKKINFVTNNNYYQFFEEYLPTRLKAFEQRLIDRDNLVNLLITKYKESNKEELLTYLKQELYKDNLDERIAKFKNRLYDRTVHPTQIYGIAVEIIIDKHIEQIIRNKYPAENEIKKVANHLLKEFLGTNVAIKSKDEPNELLLDLNSAIYAETFININADAKYQTFLSYWGDWDGSTRPSGQGHSLIAAVVIQNVTNMANFINVLHKNNINIDPLILKEILQLQKTNKKFSDLLNEITFLTHKLEKRFKGVLPYNLSPSLLRKIGMKLHLADDPLFKLRKHNDRLESKMLKLRKQRKELLEYYFALNKKLRKTLYNLLPTIFNNLNNIEILREAVLYKDLLKRFVITPRIHQKMITAQDQFAIDTTVYNIYEINEIAAKYGNGGLILGLQISMSDTAEAAISLNRKLVAELERRTRNNNTNNLPNIFIIPLFEDLDAVKDITNYLNKIWDYSFQTKRIDEDIKTRFNEIICEIFVAGSDLSQQIGQIAGQHLFKQAKYNLAVWLAEKGIIGRVRMKLGCGEPMQRQGGYYSPFSGKNAFIFSNSNKWRFSEYLKESTKKSTEYAVTPLLGVLATGDLRTFQSTISEKLRLINVKDYAQVIYHIKHAQSFYENEIIRAGEPLKETRLQIKTRGLKELERLTIGNADPIFEKFTDVFTKNFRHILYGKDEDVVGIYIISYFIARTSPVLRDRPTIRPQKSNDALVGQKILGKIANTIPFSKFGSLLRAISHNLSQTTVLGINQLTTGLFRALDEFYTLNLSDTNSLNIIEERILPKLSVYEILSTLRIYQDNDLLFISKLENAFKPGNSSLIALKEDFNAQNKYIPLLQKELLRRHGLNVNDFFEDDKFIYNLLPTIRPDLAVLLQPNIFNTDINFILNNISGEVDLRWTTEVEKLLAIRAAVNTYREKIWNLLEKPVFTRVNAFTELATALYSLTLQKNIIDLPFLPNNYQIPTIKNYGTDENMDKFLSAAYNLLSALSKETTEIPINIIKALQEAKNIIKIEEQALSEKEQNYLRFYLLQIARITGENG